MDLWTLVGLIIAGFGLVIGGVQAWYAYLSHRREQVPAPNNSTVKESLLLKLLTYVWQYPEKDGNHVTWAVKESYVLRGRLEQARQEPGLGVAIVTTEFALNVFGNKALSRIDGCITWACANRMSEFPYLLKGKKVDSRTSKETEVPDFRHTLAFAIILARTGKLTELLGGYLHYTLETQNPDGGWCPGEGARVSEVFTVLYAIELLSLCCTDKKFSEDVRNTAQVSRDRAAKWLLSATTEKGLWESGVLEDQEWDDVLSTAWVLHRLMPIKGINNPGWNVSLADIAALMISKVANPGTWKATGELQRFRAEARVAASACVALKAGFLSAHTAEAMEIYLSDWRRRTALLVLKINENDWDVATAVFVLEALFSTSQMQEAIKESGLAVC